MKLKASKSGLYSVALVHVLRDLVSPWVVGHVRAETFLALTYVIPDFSVGGESIIQVYGTLKAGCML